MTMTKRELLKFLNEDYECQICGRPIFSKKEVRILDDENCEAWLACRDCFNFEMEGKGYSIQEIEEAERDLLRMEGFSI